ncbi:MAG: radical SAM protein [Candidatus Omnitrophota bacterium]
MSEKTVKKYKRIHLWLIKPSKYDDDGYVIRYWKGVIPSNTLSCLYGLTEDVRERGVLGPELEWTIDLIDDSVEKIHVDQIVRASRQKDTKTVVCLVGVQTNQFVRSYHLAMAFRRAGIDVMIGGFHVSGALATLPRMPRELRELEAAGVSLFAGEAEGERWEAVLRDALNDKLQPVYNFLAVAPDITCAPLPKTSRKLVSRYAVANFATLDCGRGCPFACSFCTVINVQGRKMRFRGVEALLNAICDNYRQHGIHFYFFTDDNFCRNKNWEALFDAFIKLREEGKVPLSFMIQVDTKSHQVKNFVEKAARAGCSQAFIGMESINDENLKSVGKTQNNIEDYKRLVDAYQDAGIVAHLAYIIGFPFDTTASVRQDVQRLKALGAGQASFFMMTPLPGSMDYVHMAARGAVLDADLNNYDTFHETHRHARMAPGEWTRAYEAAWEDFYGIENMKNTLRCVRPELYWGIFLNFLWYKNSVQVEGGHPMLHGFVRRKGRRERRPDYALEGRWTYFKRRVRDVSSEIAGWFRLAFELEEVWLATRRRTVLEERVVLEIGQIQKRAREWRDLGLREIQAVYCRAAAYVASKSEGKILPPLRIPSRFQLWLGKLNIFNVSPLMASRAHLKRFWRREVMVNWRRGQILRINYVKLFVNGIAEAILFVRFMLSLLKRSTSYYN